ncbi:nucleotide-binding protein [Bradyrhizobium sp. 190]|uniref:TIR domain-containing protein n=1 Tax=Bradyrhizobium sp. 190 TaxID=2782658 RepID=UPI001FF8EB44|nr:TIR domain-containing protein [Bradyrhizobium sp. 190]MCK1515850.1 nucleotide-binding protein [Bradyrhizobium sp. 190]
MAERIPPKLLEKLVNVLGVTRRRVYRLIEERATANHFSSVLGALLLASENGVSIQRFASEDQLAILRGAPRAAPVQSAAEPAPSAKKSSPPPRRPLAIRTTKDNSIFVVHGRDAKLNEDMFGFLRAIGLNPKEWSQAIKDAKGANPNVGQVINNAMKQAQGVLVMFSPDEDAKLKSKFCGVKDKKKGLDKLDGQARPNVLFEAGLALGAHPDKTLLVQVGDTRDISDIAGMHLINLSDEPSSRKELAQRLATKLKFKVDMTGTSWLSNAFKFNR